MVPPNCRFYQGLLSGLSVNFKIFGYIFGFWSIFLGVWGIFVCFCVYFYIFGPRAGVYLNTNRDK